MINHGCSLLRTSPDQAEEALQSYCDSTSYCKCKVWRFIYLLHQVHLFRWCEKDDGVQELQSEYGYHGHILALFMQVRTSARKVSLIVHVEISPIGQGAFHGKRCFPPSCYDNPVCSTVTVYDDVKPCRLVKPKHPRWQSRGDFIVVGDLMRSMSLLVYKAVDGTIEVRF